MKDDELTQLLLDLESDRTERKESLSDTGRIRQAICAFANDMPNYDKPGVLFVGVKDDGSCANLKITDELLRTLADMRSDGNILPLPTMLVQKRVLQDCEMAVVIVEPSFAPPVRHNGRIWIRVGPRRATASADEERRLSEKRRSRDLPFDLHPIHAASLADLGSEMFRRDYLSAAVAPDVIEQNERTLAQQLVSMRFVSTDDPHYPTVVGLLVVGKSPTDFIPGAYIQFLRIDGLNLADPMTNRKELHGPIPDLLRRLDEVIEANIQSATDLQSDATEVRRLDYPLVALQQLARNAVMHRDYQTSTAPVRITWFKDRIEIQNPGGPFGQVTRQNFATPGITDYRNPHLAEAMKILGFVQRFGVGIQIARKELNDNGNPDPQFDVQENHILVTIGNQS